MSSAAAAVPAVAAAASAADVHEVLTRPLSLVQRLLSRAATAAPGAAAASSDEHTPLSPAQVRSLHEHLTAAGSWGVEAELERVLGLRMPRSHPSNQLASIPSLNALQSLSSASARDAALVQHFRPGQLVRFRGMVQETLQPEYFNGIVQQRVGEHKQGDGSEPQPYTTVRCAPTRTLSRDFACLPSFPSAFLLFHFSELAMIRPFRTLGFCNSPFFSQGML
jgi:hypothetical protein